MLVFLTRKLTGLSYGPLGLRNEFVSMVTQGFVRGGLALGCRVRGLQPRFGCGRKAALGTPESLGVSVATQSRLVVYAGCATLNDSPHAIYANRRRRRLAVRRIRDLPTAIGGFWP